MKIQPPGEPREHLILVKFYEEDLKSNLIYVIILFDSYFFGVQVP